MQEAKKHTGLILAVKIVLFTALVILMLNGLRAWLYPSESRGAQLEQRLESLSESPDFFVTGSSLCYRSFVPKYFEEVSGLKCIQVATSAQSALESLTLLRETVNNGVKPKYAMVYIGPASRFTRIKTDYSVGVVENLPLSLNKLNLIINDHFTLEELPDVLFTAYRAREYLHQRLMDLFTNPIPVVQFTTEEGPLFELATPLKHKKAKSDEEIRQYVGDGYEYNAQAIENDKVLITENYSVKEQNADPTVMDHWEQIAKLCKDEGIQLILVATPRMPVSILTANHTTSGNDYSDVNAYFKRLAERYGAILWDLNYLHKDLITFTPDMFMDTHHGNNKQALPLTGIMAEMCRKLAEGTFVETDYFYDSIETYRQNYKGIQGIWIQGSSKTGKDGVKTRKVKVVTGADTQAEWRASCSDMKDGEYTVCKDWSQDESIVISDDIAGKYLKIEARELGSPEIVQTGIVKVK